MADLNDEIKKSVVKRRKRDIEFGNEYNEPGDNAKYIRLARSSMGLTPIDIADPEQVENRILDYFDFCEKNDYKPSVIGMANWLGISRRTVTRWMKGDTRSSTHTEMIERAYSVIEQVLVDCMQNGKVNPASGIFLLKNFFGYRDQQEVLVTPTNPLGEETDTKKLEDKYAESVIDTTGTDIDED